MVQIEITFIIEKKLKITKKCKREDSIKKILIEILNSEYIQYDDFLFLYKGKLCKDDIKAEYFFN